MRSETAARNADNIMSQESHYVNGAVSVLPKGSAEEEVCELSISGHSPAPPSFDLGERVVESALSLPDHGDNLSGYSASSQKPRI